MLTPELTAILSGKKILVVDDENDLRDIVSAVFRRAGCEILEAENGRRALEMIVQQPVDVVITDIRMSGGDGVELLTEVRKRDAARPAVILITGFSDLTETEALRRGANAILAKPFRLQTILDAVVKSLKS